MSKTKVSPEVDIAKASMAPVEAWNRAQIKMQTSKHYRRAMLSATLGYAFIDLLGTVLFAPCGERGAMHANEHTTPRVRLG